jgi:hypothetical protein
MALFVAAMDENFGELIYCEVEQNCIGALGAGMHTKLRKAFAQMALTLRGSSSVSLPAIRLIRFITSSPPLAPLLLNQRDENP